MGISIQIQTTEECQLESIQEKLATYFRENFRKFTLQQKKTTTSQNFEFVCDIPLTEKFHFGDVIADGSWLVKKSTSFDSLSKFKIDYFANTVYRDDDLNVHDCDFKIVFDHSHREIGLKTTQCPLCQTIINHDYTSCIVKCIKCQEYFCYKCNESVSNYHECSIQPECLPVESEIDLTKLVSSNLYFINPIKNGVVMKNSVWKCTQIIKSEDKQNNYDYLYPTFSFSNYLKKKIFEESNHEIVLEHNFSVEYQQNQKSQISFKILLDLKFSKYMILEFVPTKFVDVARSNSNYYLENQNQEKISEDGIKIDASKYCKLSLKITNESELLAELESKNLKLDIKSYVVDNLNMKDFKFMIGKDLNVYVMLNGHSNMIRKCSFVDIKPSISFYANSFDIYKLNKEVNNSINLIFHHNSHERNFWIQMPSDENTIIPSRIIVYDNKFEWNTAKKEISTSQMQEIFSYENMTLGKLRFGEHKTVMNLNSIFKETSKSFKILVNDFNNPVKSSKKASIASILYHYLKFLLMQQVIISEMISTVQEYSIDSFDVQVFEKLDKKVAHFYYEIKKVNDPKFDSIQSIHKKISVYSVKSKSSQKMLQNLPILLEVLKKIYIDVGEINEEDQYTYPILSDIFGQDSYIDDMNEYSFFYHKNTPYILFNVHKFAYSIHIMNKFVLSKKTYEVIAKDLKEKKLYATYFK